MALHFKTNYKLQFDSANLIQIQIQTPLFVAFILSFSVRA
jgi:hypothetical protein